MGIHACNVKIVNQDVTRTKTLKTSGRQDLGRDLTMTPSPLAVAKPVALDSEETNESNACLDDT